MLATVLLLTACGPEGVPERAVAPPAGDSSGTGGAMIDPSASPSKDSVAGLPGRSGIPGISGPGAVASEDASPEPDLGVQVFALWRDWEDHERLMDQVVAAGSHWMRFDVGWCSLEERGPELISTWYQDRLDAVVDAAEERGISLLATLTCSPSWARSDGRSRALPENPAQYGRVAEYLADRYRGRIAAWELWNEPDCLDLGCANGSPERYVPVLKAGYTGIKDGDPDATVLSGGISGINLPWITAMFRAGAGGYLDALAVNPYQNPSKAPPTQPPAPGFEDRYRLTNAGAAHDLLSRLGYPDMPIWFTEVGWSTGRVPAPRFDGVAPQVQAEHLTEAVDLVRRNYPYVTHVFWFCLRDRDDSTPNENGFGLLRLDETPKPSYAAFKAANALVDGGGAG